MKMLHAHVCRCVRVRVSPYYAANADISIELLDMLRGKVQELRDQLSLIQPPGEIITHIEPTPTQLTGMILCTLTVL